MNLNSRVPHCVLTLIYSLHKWINKYIGKKGGARETHHHPMREETEGGAEGSEVLSGLACESSHIYLL